MSVLLADLCCQVQAPTAGIIAALNCLEDKPMELKKHKTC